MEIAFWSSDCVHALLVSQMSVLTSIFKEKQ